MLHVEAFKKQDLQSFTVLQLWKWKKTTLEASLFGTNNLQTPSRPPLHRLFLKLEPGNQGTSHKLLRKCRKWRKHKSDRNSRTFPSQQFLNSFWGLESVFMSNRLSHPAHLSHASQLICSNRILPRVKLTVKFQGTFRELSNGLNKVPLLNQSTLLGLKRVPKCFEGVKNLDRTGPCFSDFYTFANADLNI